MGHCAISLDLFRGEKPNTRNEDGENRLRYDGGRELLY
jgi:hypothetical protein